MTSELNNSDVIGLAEEIDRQNQPEFQKVFNGNQQPTDAVVVEDGPKLLPESPARLANIRAWESSQRVESGKLFHGRILSAEPREAKNGNIFLRFECELQANNWKMSCVKFLPKGSLATTEGIKAACNEIMLKLGYNESTKQFDGLKIFEIGSYVTDGKSHLKISRIFNDAADFNSYQRWRWQKEHEPKKEWRVEHAPLPEL